MYEHVLLPVDPDAETSWVKALPHAIGVAQRHGATLHIMTVVPDFGSSMVASFFPEGFENKAMENAHARLTELIAQNVPADLPHQLVIAHGRIWQEICRVAKDVEADIIVMASHKPEFSDLLLQPVAAQVLQHAPISVTIVR